ncbi:MAG TPA: hypothetical protein VF240_20925 [Pyrinomonadaceae bacterium]
MTYEGKSRRLRERVKLTLPVRVECRETADFRWTEVSRLVDVTPFGAGLALTHQTETGRLLLLTLPMPRQLRSFDHAEDQYKVWALVRNVRPHQSAAASRPDGPRFEVGVAFVGKRAPASYEQDPAQRYDVQSLTPEGNSYALVEWSAPAQEAGAGAARAMETRLSMPVDVVVEAFDERGVVQEREQTVTENISRHGASVWTTLGLERGRFVRLTSVAQRVSIAAVIRSRRAGPDGVMRLHLEFVDREWPLEGLE